MEPIFKVDPWCIEENELHGKQMRFTESVMSIGNGHMGMRGSFEEKYSGDHLGGCYLAGIWTPEGTEPEKRKTGCPAYTGKAVGSLNTISLRIRIDKEDIDLAEDRVEYFSRKLDMRRGLLIREFIISGEDGVVHVWFERFVSAVRPELLAIRCRVYADYPCRVTLLPAVTVDEQDEYWDCIDADEDGEADISYLTVRTRVNPFGVPQYTVCTAMGVVPVGEVRKDRTDTDEDEIVHRLLFDSVPGDVVGCDKFVCVATSRDHSEGEILNSARAGIAAALSEGYDALLREHEREWARRWEKADIQIDGDERSQQAVRYSLFRMFSTCYGEDESVNIGPDGFAGDLCSAATWETEAYALPMYLSTVGQFTTQNLLRYRWLQLGDAALNAGDLGLPGVLFPVLTFTGRECHGDFKRVSEEIYRNNIMAYAIYTYTRYTGDRTYLETCGIEVLTGIARFWMERVQRSGRNGQFMILGVTGPNEYESNVSNNFFTNRMTAWALQYTADELEKVSAEKRAELGVTAEEIARMREISQDMYLPRDEDLGIFEQQDLFLDRERRSVADLSPAERPICRNWSRDRILRSCFLQQADTLLALYFLEHLTDREELRRNFDFYEPMTVHETPMSACVHSILAAHLGYAERAKALFDRIARLEPDDPAENGLSMSDMAGCWLSIVQGFAGMRVTEEQLSFSPMLPEGWKGYNFRIVFRGRQLEIRTDREGSRVMRLSGEPLEILLFGEKVLI
ncbi:MAG: glycoside hydrolase family 65 protein [Clostridia bacterium]|nr:glycoside hydrolase family 65 protein [Clostridia bacterium]